MRRMKNNVVNFFFKIQSLISKVDLKYSMSFHTPVYSIDFKIEML